MIDWFNLVSNLLWILGCALALSTFSYASWKASLRGERLLERLNRHTYRFALGLAGLLFSLGLAATSTEIWRIGIWSLLGAFSLATMVVAYTKFPRKNQTRR